MPYAYHIELWFNVSFLSVVVDPYGTWDKAGDLDVARRNFKSLFIKIPSGKLKNILLELQMLY
jgi:hypothetical protein